MFGICGLNLTDHFFLLDWRWLALHVGTVGLPFTQSFYLMLGALYLFIPIMGRSGSGNNSELIIAAMVGILFSLLLSFVTPLIILVQNPGKVFSLLLGIVLISVGVLLLTPFGFPYSGDPNSPAPQRFMIAVSRMHILIIINTFIWAKAYLLSAILLFESCRHS